MCVLPSPLLPFLPHTSPLLAARTWVPLGKLHPEVREELLHEPTEPAGAFRACRQAKNLLVCWGHMRWHVAVSVGGLATGSAL